MDDVMAAIKRVKKKRIAMIPPNGRLWNISGRVTKTRLGPSVGLMPKANTAGIMATPARMAKRVSDSPVKIEHLTIFSSLET